MKHLNLLDLLAELETMKNESTQADLIIFNSSDREMTDILCYFEAVGADNSLTKDKYKNLIALLSKTKIKASLNFKNVHDAMMFIISPEYTGTPGQIASINQVIAKIPSFAYRNAWISVLLCAYPNLRIRASKIHSAMQAKMEMLETLVVADEVDATDASELFQAIVVSASRKEGAEITDPITSLVVCTRFVEKENENITIKRGLTKNMKAILGARGEDLIGSIVFIKRNDNGAYTLVEGQQNV